MHGTEFSQAFRQWARGTKAGGVGDTYMVRSRNDGHHDLLVAFQIAEVGPYGLTIVWRQMHEFPMDRSRGGFFQDADEGVTPAPPEVLESLAALDVDGLLERIRVQREQDRSFLLEVPMRLQREFREVVAPKENLAQKEGFLRLLQRGRAAALTGPDVGCYYSFTSETHGWHQSTSLGLEQSVFSGGVGTLWALDLGALTFDDLRVALSGTCPFPDEDRLATGWKLLGKMTPIVNDRREFSTSQDLRKELEGAGIATDRVPAVEGHSYLMRTAHPRTADLLVLVTVLEDDGIGMSLAWRILESFPIPAGPQGR